MLETQEFSIQVEQSRNDQTYIMKRQENTPGGGPVYDTSPSQPIPPAPPAPPLPAAARQVQGKEPADYISFSQKKENLFPSHVNNHTFSFSVVNYNPRGD